MLKLVNTFMKESILRRIIKLMALLLSTIIIYTAISLPSIAYSYLGHKIYSTIYFARYSEIGTTSVVHINNAMYSWNAASEQNLMQIYGGGTHTSLVFPQNDGNSRIYRVALPAGSIDQVMVYSSGDAVSSIDVNLNTAYSLANSAQTGKYDVWSLFLHIGGHAIGLAHPISGTTSVMNFLQTGIERRNLYTYDVNAAASLY